MLTNCRLKENKKSIICKARKLKSPIAKIKKLEEAIGMVVPIFELKDAGVTQKQIDKLLKKGDAYSPKKGLFRRVT